jgi:hypothetical protein
VRGFGELPLVPVGRHKHNALQVLFNEQINDDGMGKVYGMFEDNRMAYRTFVGKSNGTSPLESHSLKPRCELNMKMDLQEVG